MIDFRYHIVSLISVFIALAVGIALGAGPLKEAIGDTLTGQVEQLRQDRDGLRTDLTTAVGAQEDQRKFLEAAAPQLLSGSLSGRRVALVTVGPADDDTLAAIQAQLEAAGASVSAQVAVTDSWTDPELRSFRQALAGNLVPRLDVVPAQDAGTEVELAEALAQGLTGANPAAPDELSESAGLMLALLADSDSKLITVKDAVTAPADAIVVVTSPVGKDSGATPAPAEDVLAAQVAIVSAAQARSEGAVVAVDKVVPDDLVSTIIGDEDLAKNVSTVSGISAVTGQLSVPLALNARIGGKAGHFGFGDGEELLPERVTLTAVDRIPIQTLGDVPAGAGATG